MSDFLPISKRDMKARGWEQCDFVYIIGDAYVDHPSFGHAIISRVLEDAGYKVGILSQPDWKDLRSINILGEPRNCVYEKFLEKYKTLNKQMRLKQYVVPYLMSSHPGSTLKEAVALAEYLRDLGYMPEQVQDFYPTPSTISTVMYYTGLDPRTMQPVYVPTNPHEKAMQRALIQYRKPTNYALVHEALVKAGRTDLIGYEKKCLIQPPKRR